MKKCKTKFKLKPALALLLSLVFVLSAGAVPASAENVRAQVVKVGYYENEVFQEGARDNAVKNGYAYEYYRKLSEYTGWKYEYVYGEYADLYQKLLDGEIDMLAGLAWKEERAGKILYPDNAMGHETYNLVKHAADDGITAEPSTLNGKKIAVLDSAIVDVLNKFLDSHHIKAEVVKFADYEKLFNAFDNRAADVMAVEGDGTLGRDKTEVLCTIGSSDYYLCVSAKQPQLLKELNTAQTMLAAEEPNYLSALNSKYYSVSVMSRAFSAAEKNWLETHNKVEVGYLLDYLPYCDRTKDGQVTGIVKDILPKMFESLGITGVEISYKGYENYDDMVLAVNNGDVDIAFPVGGDLYYSEESGIYQTNTVASSPTELVYKGTLNENSDAVFAVNENNSMQRYFVKTNYPQAEVKLYPSIDACLEAVLRGEADLTTLNGLRAYEILKNRKYSDLSMYPLGIDDARYFGIKIGNEGLLKLINRGINVIGDDYARSRAYHYTDELHKYTVADLLIDYFWLFGAIIFAVAALIIILLLRGAKTAKARMREQEAARIALEEKTRELARSMDALEETDKILANAGFGVWHIFLEDGKAPEMTGNVKMLELLGISGKELSPNEVYDAWYSRICPEDLESVHNSVDEMLRGKLSENTYRWCHPQKGIIYVRCGGTMNTGTDKKQVLRGYHSEVTANVRKEMEQKEALSNALTEAQNANKAKTVFLSNMSHEIRTPMNAIIGLDNIALSDPGISDTTREHLEKINTSAHHLLGIINDILDMSRIESGRMTIKSEEFSFANTLAQVNTIAGGQCRDKGLHYDCHIRGDIRDYYIGDDMKLRQVMINILGNAVKFTPEGGSVTMTVEAVARYHGKSTLRFIISDTGVGMSKEFLPKIFDAFSQEDASSTSKYGSTGLGMPITKSIVEMMNGDIEVESEKGKGTTFVVTVTLLDSDRVGSDNGEFISPKDMCVLVIDDDPIACEHAGVVLGQVGVSCETAQSGAEGIEMAKVRYARREPYNLILVDLKMPELDGIETTRRIREVVGSETPVIILTSYGWDDVADEAAGAGVDSFVSKPLFAATVMDKFKEALKKKNAQLIKKTASLKGKRILLAEDMDVNAEIMMMVLSMREMVAERAKNGLEAVNMFAGHEPGYYDAILMDMRMPEMDGLEATRAIRSMDKPGASSVPIIALTANAFDEDVQRSMQAGLNAHLSKPVEPDALFHTLEGLIK